MTNSPLSKQIRLVILGGGASGTVFLVNAIRALGRQLDVTIVEPRESLGLGRAYSTQIEEHILNVPVEKMSIFSSDPLSFLKWVHTNKLHAQNLETWPFVPRAWFGAYLQEQLRQLPPKSYRHLSQMASSVERNGSEWRVWLADRTSVDADVVIVATGYHETLGRDVLHLKDRELAERVVDSYDTEMVSKISPHDRILIVGTGLTAIDVFRQLASKMKTPLYFLSRRGMFPYPHGGAPALKELRVPALSGMSPQKILRSIRKAQRESQASWAAVADQVRAQAGRIWETWPSSDRSRFIRHLKPYWEVIRHRVPAQVFETLERARKQGQLAVYEGRIQETRKEGNEIRVVFRTRSNHSAQEVRCDWIVLATGAKITQSLAKKEGVELKRCPYGFGYLNYESTKLWTVGPSSKGKWWEITAVPDIVRQVEEIIKKIPESLDL